MRKTYIRRIVPLVFGLLFCCACGSAALPEATQPMEAKPGTLSITFEYVKQRGYASNQFAVWIEVQDGTPVKTLYATPYTATGGYKNRPDSIPTWVARGFSGADIDTVASATPKAGRLTYLWDLTDDAGNPMPAGVYRFCVEGTLRWKNQVMYTGEIAVGGDAAKAEALPEFTFAEAPNQPALTNDAPECGMIGPVAAEYRAAE